MNFILKSKKFNLNRIKITMKFIKKTFYTVTQLHRIIFRYQMNGQVNIQIYTNLKS